jgi:hypothetical protein
MKKLSGALIIIALVVVTQQSCMMHGVGGGMMHGGSHDHDKHVGSSILTKEKTVGTLHIVAEFPAAAAGTEVTYSLRLRWEDSGSPVTEAEIGARIRHVAGENVGSEDHPHSGVEELQFTRSGETGLYVLSTSMNRPGEYELTFEIHTADGQAYDPPISISVLRDVAHDRMAGQFTITPLIIVGAVAMGAMMIWMMVREF